MMHGLTIALAMLFPIGCLLMVLLLDRLEETLDEDPRREPAPPRITAIPVPTPEAARTQAARTQASEGSRAIALSLGGVTNR